MRTKVRLFTSIQPISGLLQDIYWTLSFHQLMHKDLHALRINCLRISAETETAMGLTMRHYNSDEWLAKCIYCLTTCLNSVTIFITIIVDLHTDNTQMPFTLFISMKSNTRLWRRSVTFRLHDYDELTTSE
jgi:hypothetical protein